MLFISNNIAVIYLNDLINNSISLPDSFNISFTLNHKLFYPVSHISNNNTISFTFPDNLNQNDIIIAFFSKPLKGTNGIPNYNPFKSFLSNISINHINFFNTSNKSLSQPIQSAELYNLSDYDNSIVEMYTSEHLSFKENTVYDSFIPQYKNPSFNIIIQNNLPPSHIQFFFYDYQSILIQSIYSNDYQQINENTFNISFQMPNTLHQKILSYQKNYFFWKMRYATSSFEDDLIFWRNYSRLIPFKINTPPEKPTGLNII